MPKPLKSPSLPPEAGTDLATAVLDFIRRGQRAQAEVDRILAAAPERKRRPKPKGNI